MAHFETVQFMIGELRPQLYIAKSAQYAILYIQILAEILATWSQPGV